VERFKVGLSAQTLAMKSKNPMEEYYEVYFTPGVHYVELHRNLSDLVEKVEYARAHEEEAQRMVDAANAVARRVLRPQQYYCHLYWLLEQMSKSLAFPVSEQSNSLGVPMREPLELIDWWEKNFLNTPCLRDP
jgi:hypothetical protein